MNNFLYLASSSVSRRRMLTDAGIPFIVIEQDADEDRCDKNLPLKQLVQELAKLKMAHVRMPIGHAGQQAYVLTADTLGVGSDGRLMTKPVDHADAVAMVRSCRDGAETATGFCVQKLEHDGHVWRVINQIVSCATVTYVLNVPDELMDSYFTQLRERAGLDYLKLSGGFSIQGPGMQYLKEMNGSFCACVGLPIYEIRLALEELDFFKS